MSYPNSGTLGQNHYKRDGDRQPDVRNEEERERSLDDDGLVRCPNCNQPLTKLTDAFRYRCACGYEEKQ